MKLAGYIQHTHVTLCLFFSVIRGKPRDGILADIAPTLLEVMGIDKPRDDREMP